MPDTLLFADDSVTMRRVVELTFAEQGLHVVSVSDGQQAIEYIASQRPSLALVSATLQKVNGFDVARFVRDHAGGHLPVLLLAGAFDTLDAAQVQESGAAGVLVKPFEPAVVIKRVKELLGMKPAAPSETDSSRGVVSDDGLSRFGEEPESSRAVTAGARDAAATDAEAPERTEPGKDYFDQLDAAFDSLDAQLAAQSAPEARDSEVSASARIAAVNEVVSAPSVASAFADLSAAQRGSPRPAAAIPPRQVEEPPHNPVFEVDNDWFRQKPDNDSMGEPFVVTRASDFLPVPAARPTEDERPAGSSSSARFVDEAMSRSPSIEPTDPVPSSITAASTAPDTPHAASFAPLGPADAFAMLWAQEQGEPMPAPPPFAPLELSEGTVEALSSQLTGRVAERLGAQLPGSVAATVSDRVIGAVVDRITADLDGLASRLADQLATRLEPTVIDRLGDRLAAGLAERVAELTAARALEGALGESLRQTVNEVAERVVRAEIERIRAAANAKRSSA